MFWIKTITRLDITQKTQIKISLDLQKQIKEAEEKIKQLKNEAENNANIRANHEHWIEALKECANSDRKDINALIQLVKKQPKEKNNVHIHPIL